MPPLPCSPEPMTMYLVSEPTPAGFRPNKDMLVVDENTAARQFWERLGVPVRPLEEETP